MISHVTHHPIWGLQKMTLWTRESGRPVLGKFFALSDPSVLAEFFLSRIRLSWQNFSLSHIHLSRQFSFALTHVPVQAIFFQLGVSVLTEFFSLGREICETDKFPAWTDRSVRLKISASPLPPQ